MKILFVSVLVAALGQAGDDPTLRMKAMEEKIAKADSLQVTLENKIEFSKGEGSNNGTIKGTLTVAGNKGRAEFTLEFKDKRGTMQMVSNGTKMAGRQDGKAQPVKDTPKHFRDDVTAALARAGFAVMFIFRGRSGDQAEENLLEVLKASDFKKLKIEKIGDQEAMVITYQLTIKGDKVRPTAAVWLDLKTNLPLKYVLRVEERGETFTVTETYSQFRINPKLDAKLFELPK